MYVRLYRPSGIRSQRIASSDCLAKTQVPAKAYSKLTYRH